jgi:hypothetical protein
MQVTVLEQIRIQNCKKRHCRGYSGVDLEGTRRTPEEASLVGHEPANHMPSLIFKKHLTEHETKRFSPCLIKNDAMKAYRKWKYSSAIVDLDISWR